MIDKIINLFPRFLKHEKSTFHLFHVLLIERLNYVLTAQKKSEINRLIWEKFLAENKKWKEKTTFYILFFFFLHSKSGLWISTCKRNIQRKSVINTTQVFEKSKSFVIKGWLSAVLISLNMRFPRLFVAYHRIPQNSSHGNRPSPPPPPPTLWKSWPRKCVELVETNWHARTPIKTFSLLSKYTCIRVYTYTS